MDELHDIVSDILGGHRLSRFCVLPSLVSWSDVVNCSRRTLRRRISVVIINVLDTGSAEFLNCRNISSIVFVSCVLLDEVVDWSSPSSTSIGVGSCTLPVAMIVSTNVWGAIILVGQLCTRASVHDEARCCFGTAFLFVQYYSMPAYATLTRCVSC